MGAGLLRVELAAPDELLDQRVVTGQALEPIVAIPVEPAVADVAGDDVRVLDQHRGERGAHSGPRVVGLGELVDLAVRLAGRLRQPLLGSPARATAVREGLHRDPGRDLARARTAHSIGDPEQRR
jgi:hypothetical protein